MDIIHLWTIVDDIVLVIFGSSYLLLYKQKYPRYLCVLSLDMKKKCTQIWLFVWVTVQLDKLRCWYRVQIKHIRKLHTYISSISQFVEVIERGTQLFARYWKFQSPISHFFSKESKKFHIMTRNFYYQYKIVEGSYCHILHDTQ